jgi:cytochrome P450
VTLSTTDYYRIVQSLLLELVPSALAVIPATFGSLINAMLGQRVNLSYLIPHLDKLPSGDGVKRLIYEMNRLSPSLPLLQRYAKEEVVLGEGMKIEKGNWIGALVVAANLDKDVFPEPRVFSLGAPYGPKRDLDDYIMFGSVGSDRECFGRDRLAMLALAKFLRAAAKFPGLRRVAGAGGVPVPIIRTMIGLPAKFARF